MYERMLLPLFFSILLVSGCSFSTEVFRELPLPETTETIQKSLETDEPTVKLKEKDSPFKTDWPEKFSIADLSEATFAETDMFFDSRTSGCELSAEIRYQNNVEEIQEIQEIGAAAVQIFCNELTEDLWLIVGEYSFLKEQMQANSLKSDDHGGVCGIYSNGPNTGCALHSTAWVSETLSGEIDGNMINGVAAHEMFHLVQDSMMSGGPWWTLPYGDPKRAPLWLTEGSAVTMQTAITGYLSITEHDRFISYHPLLEPSSEAKINLSNFESSGGFGAYTVGNFATAYLIANVGMDNFLQIWKNLDGDQTFEEAFLNATDISLEDFYYKVSKIDIIQ